jgi:putative transposase
VAHSGFYAWRQRQQNPGCRARENAVITAQVQAVFERHRGFYGAPRIHQELRAADHKVGRHRVARLMRNAALKAKTLRGFWHCQNTGDSASGVAENLQQQEFPPVAPNRCWAGDITYIRTTAGWRYLAVWIDLYSRRVVGWAMGATMEATLVLGALNRALGHRQIEPDQLLIHTDRGSQPSTGRRPTGSCWKVARSAPACRPRAAAGTTRWWRASSPPLSTNLISMTPPRPCSHPSSYNAVWRSGSTVTTTVSVVTQRLGTSS